MNHLLVYPYNYYHSYEQDQGLAEKIWISRAYDRAEL